jgi:hypothetical protein
MTKKNLAMIFDLGMGKNVMPLLIKTERMIFNVYT